MPEAGFGRAVAGKWQGTQRGAWWDSSGLLVQPSAVADGQSKKLSDIKYGTCVGSPYSLGTVSVHFGTFRYQVYRKGNSWENFAKFTLNYTLVKSKFLRFGERSLTGGLDLILTLR